MKMNQDKIEILSVDLLDEHRPLVEELRVVARRLGLEFGWHYLLDLTWIIKHLGDVKGKSIVDAGAGTGVIQWFLAGRGGRILSVDKISRAYLPLRFRANYLVGGFRPEDLVSNLDVIRYELAQPGELRQKAKRLVRNLLSILNMLLPRVTRGGVLIYNQDLGSLVDLPDECADYVVAISSLEHNAAEALTQVVSELMRVLKPGGALFATLGAAREQDWFHQPSKGWNYTETSIRQIFKLDHDVPSNYGRHDELMSALRDCTDLRENLASFYYLSGDKGMPWGKWDPKYLPVGVCKLKD
jgi:SAM-dependent methyltransferase